MTKYQGDTEDIRVLKEAVQESVSEALKVTLGQDLTGASSIFPLYTCKQVAKLFHVSPYTVRAWVKQGELHPRYQVLSGRACRLIFTNRDLLRFFDENFPSPEDLGDHPCSPRQGSKAARLIAAMFKMNALYARRRQRVERE